ncbi:hypothetical protein FHS90_000139 [Rufibacter quisquiliarum]|uniref:Uncharacterized protein n=1 Tax=Rufibacter quisquiliarum TaxID=1549639 RepID=A0A839G8X5_9BACT|nr:hypothetical protein [Rufibacter quisquiliarum]
MSADFTFISYFVYRPQVIQDIETGGIDIYQWQVAQTLAGLGDTARIFELSNCVGTIKQRTRFRPVFVKTGRKRVLPK